MYIVIVILIIESAWYRIAVQTIILVSLLISVHFAKFFLHNYTCYYVITMYIV